MNDNKKVPEIITFYLDIIKDSIKRRRLTKAIENFIEDKKEVNPNSSFRLFYYKKQMEPFLSEIYTDADKIEDLIKDDWKKHKGEQESRLENGLFFCLSQIAAEAAKKKSKFKNYLNFRFA